MLDHATRAEDVASDGRGNGPLQPASRRDEDRCDAPDRNTSDPRSPSGGARGKRRLTHTPQRPRCNTRDVAVERPGERATTSDRTPPLLGAAGSSSARRKHATDADTRTV